MLFDTSASQQGAYRDAALAALEAMLAGMRPSDRVQIVAVDLDAVPLMEGFAAASGPEVGQAIAALRERAPLGSTNMERGLQRGGRAAGTSRSRPAARSPTSATASSMANMLDAATLRPLVDRLRATRTPVSSYAIGPEVDGQTLAVLANHTGGNLYVAEPLAWEDDAAGVTDERAAKRTRGTAQAVGKHLADVVARRACCGRRAAQLPDAVGTDRIPSPFPPLRADRDTVLLGRTTATLAGRVDVQVTAAGADGAAIESARGTSTPEASNQDQAYLAELVDVAEPRRRPDAADGRHGRPGRSGPAGRAPGPIS